MKNNSHFLAPNMNLVMIYRPDCKYSTDMRKHFSDLSYLVAQNKSSNLNMIGINDGLSPEYHKIMPGNVQITYYPMILLFKNDPWMSIEEFNANEGATRP